MNDVILKEEFNPQLLYDSVATDIKCILWFLFFDNLYRTQNCGYDSQDFCYIAWKYENHDLAITVDTEGQAVGELCG